MEISDKMVGQSILGSERFVTWIQRTFLENRTHREIPAVAKIHRHLSKDEVLRAVMEETGGGDVLQSSGITRQLVMIALYKYAGLNNREIGDLFGVDYFTVSQGRKRLRDKAQKDMQVQTVVSRVENRLSKIKV